MWILRTVPPKGQPKTFRLSAGSIKTVGRSPRADFVVLAPLVSRIHCRLTAGDNAIEVVDLSSTNGTFVNGKRVKDGHLKTGDSLRVGRMAIKVDKRDLAAD